METGRPPSRSAVNPVVTDRLRDLPGKVREKGAGWLLHRLWREIFVPTTPATQRVRDTVAALYGRLRPAGQAGSADLLPAFYDLEVNPITFDFTHFIVGAEIAARRAGKVGFLLVLVPGREEGLREEIKEYDAVMDASARKWRIGNMLLPIAQLSPWCRGIVVCASRAQADAYVRRDAADNYPPNYQSQFPRAFEYVDFFVAADRPGCFDGLRASEQGLRHVRRWIELHAAGRRLLTVTLRSYAYLPARNTDRAAWAEFLRGLDQTRYAVVIVPDTEVAFEPLPEFPGLPVFGEAAWNIELRMALYEAAYANLFVSSGPAGLAHMNPVCRYLYTKIVVPGVAVSSEEMQRSRGLVPGQSPPFATTTQLWWWRDDSADSLREGFRVLIDRIESKP